MAWLGIDLGGTKVQAVRAEPAGDGVEVVAQGRRRTPPGEPAAVVAAIAALVEDVGGVEGVEGVGVGAPGAVDHVGGTVLQAPNLDWAGPVPLGPLLSEALGGVDVAVDNDVNVAVLAELRLGAARGAHEVLGVFWGTGVGGGVVLDGALRRGPAGVAGELGHVVVRAGGRRCGCGHPGHLEAYAGRAAMERAARERHAAGESTALVELAGEGRMKSGVWAKALAAGDAVAVGIVDEAVEALGVAIASADALLDLELAVLGGGVADKLGPAVVERVDQAARRALFVRSSTLRVVPAVLGDLGGATGAALLAASGREDGRR